MAKLNGGGALPPKASAEQLIKGLIGGALSILVLGYLSQISELPLIMAPFGASCVLLFAAPASPLAQPRNVVIGHLVTASIGLVFLHSFGDSIYVASLAVGTAIMLMQLFRVVHPPAGANPLVIILSGQTKIGFDFLITPVLVGSLGLVLIAAIINNIGSGSNWPVYWYGVKIKKVK